MLVSHKLFYLLTTFSTLCLCYLGYIRVCLLRNNVLITGLQLNLVFINFSGDANENHGSVPQNQQAVENRFASSDDESSSSESSESEPENWKLESKKGSEVDDEDVNDPSGDEASKTSEKLEKHSDNHEDVSTDTEEQPEPASKANVEAGKAELGFDQEKDGKNLPSEDHSDAESDSDKSSTSSSEQNSDEDELDLHKDNSIPHANIDQNSDEDHPQPTGDGKEHLKPDDDAKSSESESPQFKDLDSEFHKNLEREKPVTNFDENLDKTDTASSAPSSENMLPIEAEKDLQPYSGDQVGLESSGNDQLHGNNFESPSSSSSDDDEGGPLVVRQQPEIHEMPQEVPGDFGGRLPSIDRRNTNYSPPPGKYSRLKHASHYFKWSQTGGAILVYSSIAHTQRRTVARKFSIGGLYVCSVGLYILKFDENSTDL